ncbi:helix-turn-helix domain-containing protein [Patescibacteria group bacterium]|nr:helix-turn-helix domain-containing protein [Patescibacteria group bacterium]MBU1124097.1 helix-turn-helix domain-containing protein [Patescibacteria group bacterium]
MGKIDYRQLKKSSYELLGREFWTTCNSAKSTEQLTRFINGVLSPSETVMVARRIQAAKRLLNKEPQTKVMKDLNIGQSTVDKVEQWILRADKGTLDMLKKKN